MTCHIPSLLLHVLRAYVVGKRLLERDLRVVVNGTLNLMQVLGEVGYFRFDIACCRVKDIGQGVGSHRSGVCRRSDWGEAGETELKWKRWVCLFALITPR